MSRLMQLSNLLQASFQKKERERSSRKRAYRKLFLICWKRRRFALAASSSVSSLLEKPPVLILWLKFATLLTGCANHSGRTENRVMQRTIGLTGQKQLDWKKRKSWLFFPLLFHQYRNRFLDVSRFSLSYLQHDLEIKANDITASSSGSWGIQQSKKMRRKSKIGIRQVEKE